jgi:hypothetical protein
VSHTQGRSAVVRHEFELVVEGFGQVLGALQFSLGCVRPRRLATWTSDSRVDASSSSMRTVYQSYSDTLGGATRGCSRPRPTHPRRALLCINGAISKTKQGPTLCPTHLSDAPTLRHPEKKVGNAALI